jgi:hypothetical protein
MRPFELLLLAGAMWWGFNRSIKNDRPTLMSDTFEGQATESKWAVWITIGAVAGATISYLVVVTTMLSIIEPEGLGWTLATAGAGITAGTLALLFVKRAGQAGLSSIFHRREDVSGS